MINPDVGGLNWAKKSLSLDKITGKYFKKLTVYTNLEHRVVTTTDKATSRLNIVIQSTKNEISNSSQYSIVK